MDFTLHHHRPQIFSFVALLAVIFATVLPNHLWAADDSIDNFLQQPTSIQRAAYGFAPPCFPGCPTPPEPSEESSVTGPGQTDSPVPDIDVTPETSPAPPSMVMTGFAPAPASANPGSFGYIDNARVMTQLRTRFDAGYNIDRADRAEFLYTTWQAFGGKAPNPPVVPDPDVDYQTLSLYYEHVVSRGFSVFVEVPFLWSDPSLSPNHSGLYDIQTGFKYSLHACPCSQLTFQLKNYLPTGDEDKWLTAGHYSIEPGLLYWKRLNSCWSLAAEVRDWISIDGAVFNNDDYAGNVLRYGVGLDYRLIQGCGYSVTPVVEVVGWSVLDGQKFNTDVGAPQDASDDTIVNVKVGARIATCGCSDFYVGWGHAITGDRWYEDIARVEWRRRF